MRASAGYRLKVAQNLLMRLFLETSDPGVETRLAGERASPMPDDKVAGSVHDPLRHDSAHKHVAGEAAYIDDLPEPAGLLHVYLGLSAKAHARITRSTSGPCAPPPASPA
jgi:hypothetical protein